MASGLQVHLLSPQQEPNEVLYSENEEESIFSARISTYKTNQSHRTSVPSFLFNSPSHSSHSLADSGTAVDTFSQFPQSETINQDEWVSQCAHCVDLKHYILGDKCTYYRRKLCTCSTCFRDPERYSCLMRHLMYIFPIARISALIIGMDGPKSTRFGVSLIFMASFSINLIEFRHHFPISNNVVGIYATFFSLIGVFVVWAIIQVRSLISKFRDDFSYCILLRIKSIRKFRQDPYCIMGTEFCACQQCLDTRCEYAISNGITDCNCTRCEAFHEVASHLGKEIRYCPCPRHSAHLKNIYYTQNLMNSVFFILILSVQSQFWDKDLGFNESWQRTTFLLFSLQMTSLIVYINSHSCILLHLLLVETDHHVFELSHAVFSLDDFRYDIDIWNQHFRDLLTHNGDMIFSHQILNFFLILCFSIAVILICIDSYKLSEIRLPFWVVGTAMILVGSFLVCMVYVRRINHAYHLLGGKLQATLNQMNQSLVHQTDVTSEKDRIETIIEKAVKKLKDPKSGPMAATLTVSNAEQQPKTIKSVISFEDDLLERKGSDSHGSALSAFRAFQETLKTQDSLPAKNMPKTPRGSRRYSTIPYSCNTADIRFRYGRLKSQLIRLQEQEKQLMHLFSFRLTSTFIDASILKVSFVMFIVACIILILDVPIDYCFLPVVRDS